MITSSCRLNNLCDICAKHYEYVDSSSTRMLTLKVHSLI
jgi:hypothetical protein